MDEATPTPLFSERARRVVAGTAAAAALLGAFAATVFVLAPKDSVDPKPPVTEKQIAPAAPETPTPATPEATPTTVAAPQQVIVGAPTTPTTAAPVVETPKVTPTTRFGDSNGRGTNP